MPTPSDTKDIVLKSNWFTINRPSNQIDQIKPRNWEKNLTADALVFYSDSRI